MVSYIILSGSMLAIGTLVSGAQLNAHKVDDLLARSIDPKTMDPIRLSVLSVLRTAIPSGTAFPRPTGDFEPEWYKRLPADVKSLLPSLYPVAAAESSVSASASAPLSASMSAAASGTPVPGVSSSVSASLSLSSCPVQVTATKTLKLLFTATGGSALPTNGSTTASASTNRTVSTASPSPSGYLSTGARTVMRMETLAALAWVGLGAGFFLLA